MSSNPTHVFRNPRPMVVIENIGGKQLGSCYNASYYRVTALYRLSENTLRALNVAGVMGYGQTFSIRSQCDGKEEPAGEDDVKCVTVDCNGEVIADPAINPYTNVPYKSAKIPYFVYECETTCDSGD